MSHDIVAWSIAILSLLGAVSAMWFATRQEPVVPPVVQLQVEAGEGLEFDDRAPAITISRSADQVAWSACAVEGCRLYTRSIGSVVAKALEGTDDASAPFFSPDGRWLGFFADGKLKKVLVQGGPPIVIADAPHPGGGTWMNDGRIVFAASSAAGLFRVSDTGGAVEAFTQPSVAAGELRHVYPSATLSGDAVTFIAVRSAVSGTPGRLMLRPYRGSTARVLVDNVTTGTLVGREFVAYTRGPNLFAQPYHSGEQEISGGEQVVASGVLAPHVALSASGALAYAAFNVAHREPPPPRWRWSVPGRQTPVLPPLLDAVLSPSGTHVAGIAIEPATELWTADLTRGTTARVTHSTPASSPAWSEDGASVYYASKRSNRYEIWMRESSANGEERQVLAAEDRHLFPASVARQRLAYVETGGQGGADVGILDLATRQLRPVANTRFDETAPALSADGQWVAYQTDQSGQSEIVLLDLVSGRRSPISTTGGTRPIWSPDSRSLFFESRGTVLRAVIGARGEPEGTAIVVHALKSERVVGIASDGSLLLERNDTARGATAVVTLEWIRELRRTVGPPPVALPR